MKNKLIPLFCLLSIMLIKSISFAQNNNPKYYIENKKDTIFTEPNSLPVFVYELYNLDEYIQANLKYPKTAYKDNISGTVYLTFVIDNKGIIKNIQIIKGIRDDLNKEAIRLVSSMPKWTPGMYKGRYITAEYKLQVKFILDK